ncbi:MAG: thiamine pyrophosphate-binding protein [Eubacterium sp.]|nr:thiamine pyrophosphate-binding protein [Eubacterium sp.]
MKRRVADIIMDFLVENGIDTCFGVVGGGAMHLDNALALNNNIRKIFNHHEQASAMAAEAYARISGRMAAVCVTSGPGATNAITGVMGCWQDSLPMLVLSGQVRYAISIPQSGLPLRYRGIQEFDIVHSVQNMTKYVTMVTDPLSIKKELGKAIKLATSGRKGPVWIDVPLDVQSAIVEEDDLYEDDFQPDIPKININDVVDTFKILKDAQRPVILAGNGIVNSGNLDAFREFAYTCKLPVIDACIAADAMYTDYPLYYGMSGSIGPRTGNFIVQNADVILSLGCNLGFKMTGWEQSAFAPNAYIIAVDIDENEMKKPGVRVDKHIYADLGDFFKAASVYNGEIEVKQTWLDYCNALKERFTPYESIENIDLKERVCSYYFWKIYEKYEPQDSITILGNNTACSAKLQIGIKQEGQRIVANNNCGSMGADLPEAVGAAISSGKDIVCVTGDGSIMMNLQELQTIRHYNLPVKVIVFSNDGYNAIRQTCKNFFNGTIIGCTKETGVSFPEFKDIAKTFGMDYMICHNNEEVEDKLKEFFDKKGQVLLEIEERLDDPVIPKVSSRMKEDGSFETPSLEDMAPFISEEEHRRWMISER